MDWPQGWNRYSYVLGNPVKHIDPRGESPWEAVGQVRLECVVEALRVVSDATEVPLVKLRPTDRFTVELAPERGWELDDGLAGIAWYVESRSKGSSEGLETVDDLIHLLDRLEPEHNSPALEMK